MAKDEEKAEAALTRSWDLSHTATFGSAIRIKGIYLELRARMPVLSRKSLSVRGKTITLAMPETSADAFETASALVSRILATIETLPILPREIEEILAISTSERRRWLEDGRLPSAGTRTIALRGRARKITFHVFDPKIVEELLDRGMVDEWRETDAETKLENRRRAAYQAKLTRSLKKAGKSKTKSKSSKSDAPLAGWEAFERDGFLR